MAGESYCVTRYRDCKVLREGKLVLDDVWVSQGKIIDPMKLFFRDRRLPDRIVDCSGLIASPGFIDLQVNGAYGVDFSSFEVTGDGHTKASQSTDIERGVCMVAKQLLQYGVTSFCPTIITSAPEYYKRVLPAIKRTKGGRDGAAILGVHCEGPFISREKKGAHRENLVQDSICPKKLSQCYESLDNISIVTLAPELSGATETIKWLCERGIVVSMGHSMASLKIAERAVREGASLITHLFNAMLPFHHRDPGIVGLLTSLAVDQHPVYYGLIADGNHTHETVQRIAHHANKNGAVLVTDSMAAMGFGDGIHPLGTMSVEIEGNVAKLAGTDTLAGSVTSLDCCVRLFQKATACTSAEALAAASLHPAKVLELDDHKGKLDFNYDADMVLLTEDLHPVLTCIAGEVVWKKPGTQLPELI